MKFEAIRNFIFSCPALDPAAPVNTDLVGDKPISYSIGFMPPLVLSQNIIGGETIRERFTLDATMETDNNARRQAAMYQAYDFWKWLNEQGKEGNFPDAAEQGETIQAMTAENPLRLDFEGGNMVGLYQIQFYIDYNKEA